MVNSGINNPIDAKAKIDQYNLNGMTSAIEKLTTPPENLTLWTAPTYALSLLNNFALLVSSIFVGLISFLFAWTNIFVAIFSPLGSLGILFSMILIAPLAIIEIVGLFLVMYRVAVIVRGVLPSI